MFQIFNANVYESLNLEISNMHVWCECDMFYFYKFLYTHTHTYICLQYLDVPKYPVSKSGFLVPVPVPVPVPTFSGNWEKRRSSLGGCKSQGDRPLQLKESPSMPNLKLNWASTESTCQSGDWLSWHINLLTDTSTTELPEEPKRVEERERAQFPIKEAEVQLWICPDHLLQWRIC